MMTSLVMGARVRLVSLFRTTALYLPVSVRSIRTARMVPVLGGVATYKVDVQASPRLFLTPAILHQQC